MTRVTVVLDRSVLDLSFRRCVFYFLGLLVKIVFSPLYFRS
jgi:hypothetical protein